MTVAVKVQRTGPAVLEALLASSPAEADTFESEYRAALAAAAETLDVSPAERILTHWWGIAHLRLQPLSEDERDLLRRFHAGEDVGWASPAEYKATKSA